MSANRATFASRLIGRDGRARLANAMRGTVRQACLVAPCANTIAEAERRERSAELGHDEREVANWRRVDAPLKLWQHGNVNRHTRLVAPVFQAAVTHMLPPEIHHVATRGSCE